MKGSGRREKRANLRPGYRHGGLEATTPPDLRKIGGNTTAPAPRAPGRVQRLPMIETASGVPDHLRSDDAATARRAKRFRRMRCHGEGGVKTPAPRRVASHYAASSADSSAPRPSRR